MELIVLDTELDPIDSRISAPSGTSAEIVTVAVREAAGVNSPRLT
jgi:hypothetical protein